MGKLGLTENFGFGIFQVGERRREYGASEHSMIETPMLELNDLYELFGQTYIFGFSN